MAKDKNTNSKSNKNQDIRGIFETLIQNYGEGEYSREQLIDLLVDVANGKDVASLQYTDLDFTYEENSS